VSQFIFEINKTRSYIISSGPPDNAYSSAVTQILWLDDCQQHKLWCVNFSAYESTWYPRVHISELD